MSHHIFHRSTNDDFGFDTKVISDKDVHPIKEKRFGQISK